VTTIESMGMASRSREITRRLVEASVVLMRHDGRALLLRRRPDDRSFAHKWCLPGGRIERGESPNETAVREAREETGIAPRIEESLGPRRITLIHRALDFHIHTFVGTAPHGRVILSDEHVDARWVSRDEARLAEELLPSGLAGEVTTELIARFARGEV